MRKQNVICFSSGKSLPIVDLLVEKVKDVDQNIDIISWKTFIDTAYGASLITGETTAEAGATPQYRPLFRFLTKNIPSFDFAIIIAGQDDTVYPNQSDTIGRCEMRDNVVFELGMCCMALGESKVVLLQQEGVRLLDDLRGNDDNTPELTIDNIQLKAFSFKSREDIPSVARNIAAYINSAAFIYDPVIVGSACATANAYCQNFISSLNYAMNLRCVKKDENTVSLDFPEAHQDFIELCNDLDNIEIHVMLPTKDVLKIENFRYECSKRFYENTVLNIVKDCKIKDPGRTISFACKKVGNKLFIIDIPTTILASYDVAKTITRISDNTVDAEKQQTMYLVKEIDMFKETLRGLLKGLVERNKLPIKCVMEEITLNDDIDRKNVPWLYDN